MKNFLEKMHNPDLGLLLLRVALAFVFINHAYVKYSNIEYMIGFFGSIGLPALVFYIVMIIEFVAGAALLLGVFVRVSSVALSVIMIGAVFLVKFNNGFGGSPGKPGFEFDFVLLLVALAIVFLGAGRYSLRKFLSRNEPLIQ